MDSFDIIKHIISMKNYIKHYVKNLLRCLLFQIEMTKEINEICRIQVGKSKCC